MPASEVCDRVPELLPGRWTLFQARGLRRLLGLGLLRSDFAMLLHRAPLNLFRVILPHLRRFRHDLNILALTRLAHRRRIDPPNNAAALNDDPAPMQQLLALTPTPLGASLLLWWRTPTPNNAVSPLAALAVPLPTARTTIPPTQILEIAIHVRPIILQMLDTVLKLVRRVLRGDFRLQHVEMGFEAEDGRDGGLEVVVQTLVLLVEGRVLFLRLDVPRAEGVELGVGGGEFGCCEGEVVLPHPVSLVPALPLTLAM